MKIVFLAWVVMATLLSGTAVAASIPIQNPSFETMLGGSLPEVCSPTWPNCWFGQNEIPGWSKSGVAGQWITGGSSGNPPASSGIVLGFANAGGSIWQDIALALPDTTYYLYVDVLHRADHPLAGVVQLQLDGVVVATATGTDPGPGVWSLWAASYRTTGADAGKTLTVLLSADQDQGDFDRVRAYDAAIPEPASTALVGLGLVCLAGLARRQSR
ncbi:MAG: PEP-CTERM sorting domain-containing protein [Bryobacterales bacterium]|nr:PEP-CTERM sorting domain-containing protein [Bryobacterales bacterium]